MKHKRGKSGIRRCFRFIAVVLLGCTAFDSYARADSGYILLLNSINFQDGWSKVLRDVLSEELMLDENIPILTEELNVPLLRRREEIEPRLDTLRRRYPDPPRMVVLVGDPGWLVCRPLFDDIWKDVPVLLCYSRDRVPATLADLVEKRDFDEKKLIPTIQSTHGYNVTRILLPFYPHELVSVMQQLIPDMERVAFVSDNRYISVMARQETERAFREHYPRIQLDLLSYPELSTESLLDTLGGYNSKTGVVYYSWFVPAHAGSFDINDKVQKFIFGLTESPVFTLTDLDARSGLFAGGYYISAQSFGRTVTKVIREVLDGRQPRDIPAQLGGEPELYLNYLHLLQYQVDPSRFPDRAVYYQVPPNFFQRYRFYLIAGIGLIGLAIAVLLLRFRIYLLKQRQQEREFALSAEYRKLIHDMPIIFFKKQFVRDVSGQITGFVVLDVNPAFERRFGIRKEDVVGLHSDFFKQMRTRYEFFDVEIGRSGSVTMTEEDGTVRYYDKLVFEGLGKDVVDVFCIDKTDSYRVFLGEEAYRKSLESMLNNLPIAIWVKEAVDGRFRYIFWNKKAEKLLGILSEEVIGRTDTDFTDRPDAELLSENDNELLYSDGSREAVNEYRLRDGESHFLYKQKNRITLPDGREWLLCSALDVTEMQQARRSLEVLNGKYQLILNAARMIVWTWDAGDRAFHCELFSKLYEKPEQKVWREDDFYEIVHPDDRERVRRVFSDLKTGKIDLLDDEFRAVFGERTEWMECFAIVGERKEDGMPKELVGATLHITIRKEMEQNLRDATEQAEKADHLKSAFLANMSHEIRTPLNAIVGFSNILAQTDNSEERKEYVGIIEKNNQLLLQLINDILDLSKIEAETLSFEESDVDIDRMLSELELSLRMRMPSGPVNLSFERQGPHSVIRADRNRLMQVMTNLITNAIKFTKEGSIRFGYRIEPDERICFYVKDTGCGIAPEDQEKIFGRFVKLNSFVQGTGLGLSICEMIVRRMGGAIGVRSRLDEGSEFWFRLPYVFSVPGRERPEAEEPAEVQSSPTLEPQAASERKTILIAEDNPSNYKLFSAILRGQYRIVHAWDGEEALQLFEKEQPQLILMDIKMPRVDGYEATRRIRAISAQVPIVAVTAFAAGEDEKRIRESGFTDYLSKPVDANRLREKVASFFREK